MQDHDRFIEIKMVVILTKSVQCPLCNVFMVGATILGWNGGSNFVYCVSLGDATPKCTIIIAFRTTSGSLLHVVYMFFVVFFVVFLKISMPLLNYHYYEENDLYK